MALAQTTDSTPLAVPGEQRGGAFSAWISCHGIWRRYHAIFFNNFSNLSF
jgi:hypothetical protein